MDLRAKGWTVREKTVADSMRRQGLVARIIKRRNGLTRQDKTAPKFPDLVRRDFTATAVNTKWVGDITEIPTAAGKLYLATVIDLYSRRLLGAATSRHPDAALACAALEMAIAVRGGTDPIRGVIFHTDRGSTYTAEALTKLCRDNGIRQSMGRVGSCVDMPPPRRSSPPWSGRSCPGTSSPIPTTPNGSWPTGASSSTTQASSQLGCDDDTGLVRDRRRPPTGSA